MQKVVILEMDEIQRMVNAWMYHRGEADHATTNIQANAICGENRLIRFEVVVQKDPNKKNVKVKNK